MTERTKDFEVQDRRASKVQQEEQPAADIGTTGTEPGAEPDAPRQAAATQPQSKPGEPEAAASAGKRQPLPEMDFSTFIISLATSAYVQLGVAVHPERGEREPPDLAMARQTIDILGMLEQKTRGNLTEAEAGLLQQLLFDLRLQFVEASSGAGSGPAK